MNQKIISTLQRIKNEFGIGIFNDSRRVKAFLADYLQNEYQGECRLLLLILDEGLPKKMLQGHTFSETELYFHADYIAETHLREKDKVMSALECWQQVIVGSQPRKSTTPVKKEAKPQPDNKKHQKTLKPEEIPVVTAFDTTQGKVIKKRGYKSPASDNWWQRLSAGAKTAVIAVLVGVLILGFYGYGKIHKDSEARAKIEQDQRASEARARMEQAQRESEAKARMEQTQREAEARARAEQAQRQAEARARAEQAQRQAEARARTEQQAQRKAEAKARAEQAHQQAAARARAEQAQQQAEARARAEQAQQQAYEAQIRRQQAYEEQLRRQAYEAQLRRQAAYEAQLREEQAQREREAAARNLGRALGGALSRMLSK